jgi:hypothetical protein
MQEMMEMRQRELLDAQETIRRLEDQLRKLQEAKVKRIVALEL